MIEHGMYFGKSEFYQIIRDNGGSWNDSKERPIICLIKSIECDNLYWAIPVGNYEHRNEQAKERIQKFIQYNKKDIRSCFFFVEYAFAYLLCSQYSSYTSFTVFLSSSFCKDITMI